MSSNRKTKQKECAKNTKLLRCFCVTWYLEMVDCFYTPWKIIILNLKIIPLKRKIIWTKPPFWGSMLICAMLEVLGLRAVFQNPTNGPTWWWIFGWWILWPHQVKGYRIAIEFIWWQHTPMCKKVWMFILLHTFLPFCPIIFGTPQEISQHHKRQDKKKQTNCYNTPPDHLCKSHRTQKPHQQTPSLFLFHFGWCFCFSLSLLLLNRCVVGGIVKSCRRQRNRSPRCGKLEL